MSDQRQTADRVDPVVDGDLPSGLVEAFWEYEHALMVNDTEALDRFFAPGESTVRTDASGLLVGHDRIGAFRRMRGGTPARTIAELRIQVVSPSAALVVSVSRAAKGGSGVQTQLWRLLASGAWAIAGAHVQAAPPAVDRTVWRVVGDPLAASTASGPLDGMTVAVKDLFAVRGFAVGAGIPEYLAESPIEEADADAVAALRAAGAAVLGIARTDEFAYSVAGRNAHYGTPPNPAVPGALPGGSSSGPASAVALGQATIGLATDTAGSIRVPASYQGLWGIRTTHGAVSAQGLAPLAPSFDTIGWLTRSAATLEAAAAASLDPEMQAVAPEAFVVSADLLSSCSPEVRAAFDRGVASLGGVELVDLGDLDEAFAAFRTVQGAEAWAADGAWVSAHPGVLGADVAERFEIASRISPEEEADARARLMLARERLDAALAGRTLLLPSTSSTAPGLDAPPAEIAAVRAGTLRMTAVAGVGGYPAVSAPVLSAPSAVLAGRPAPLGLCLVGPRYSDLSLIALAASFAT
ncbi:AtzH-like domain-containing protein [Cnuibacter sp. UC19_7]|uniref:AtzH-like domain-containing protein n=1 Tax=Cnuibacter sp. UC19_7 TaxID=3350166 RepID=UPI0036700B9A